MPFAPLPVSAIVNSINVRAWRRNGVGATVSGGGVLLQKGRLFPATLAPDANHNIASATWRLTMNGVEQAVSYFEGGGQYDDGSYRSVYLEFSMGVDTSVAKVGTLTFNTSRTVAWTGGARVYTDLLVGGQIPVAWLDDITLAGSPLSLFGASDGTYTSKCGAAGIWATDAEAVAQFGADATKYFARFDEFMAGLTGTRSKWNGATNNYWSKFNRNDGVNGSPFTSADGIDHTGHWTTEPPLQYATLIKALGHAPTFGPSPFFPQFHDPGWSNFVRYMMTGNFEYLYRANCYAWWHRLSFTERAIESPSGSGSWIRLKVDGSRGFGSGIVPALQSMEGIYGAYLSTMFDGYRALIADFCTSFATDLAPFGLSGSATAGQTSEPRAAAKVGLATLCAKNASRPFGEAAPKAEPSAGYYKAKLLVMCDRHAPPIGYVGPDLQIHHNSAPGPWIRKYYQTIEGPMYDTTTVAKVGYDLFLTVFCLDWIQKLHDDMALWTVPDVTRMTNIEDISNDVCNFMYDGEYEGDPEINPTAPVPGITAPAFRVGFAGMIDPSVYSTQSIDLTNYFTPLFAWDSRRGSGSRRAIANRLFHDSLGDDNYDGANSPYYLSSIHKQASEQTHLGLRTFAELLVAPAPTAIPSDTTDSIRVTGGMSFTGTAGSINAVTALAQTRIRYALPGKVYSARSLNTAVATVSINSSTGVASITKVAPGVTQVYLTADGVDSAPITISVTAPQYVQDFSSGVVDPALTVTIVGDWTATVVGGGLRIGGDDPGFTFSKTVVVKTPVVSLDLAGVAGAVIKITSRTNDPRGMISMVDATGKGFGVQITPSYEAIGSYVDAFNSTIDAQLPWPGATSWLRFVKNGGNYEISDSVDGSSWNLIRTSAIPAGMDTAHCRMSIGVGMGSVGSGVYLFIDDINIAGGLTQSTHLAFTTQPGGAVSGALLTTQPVVTRQNDSDNSVSTDAAVINLSLVTISGGPGVLSGTTSGPGPVFAPTNLRVTGAGVYDLAAS